MTNGPFRTTFDSTPKIPPMATSASAGHVITGAIPEDLSREKQDRIAAELKQANLVLATAEVVFAKIEDTLNRALALVGPR